MITRRALGLTGVAALGLSACGKGQNDGVSGPGEVNFSVLSGAPPQALAPVWQPILADMAAQTGLKVRPFFSGNYGLLVERMKARKTDVGWFSNLSGLAAVRRANGEVFARTYEASGADGYTALLLVNARSKLTLDKVLKCDRTLSLGLGDPLSTSGTLAPMAYLFAPHGVRPDACFKRVVAGASHQDNLASVAAGRLDVATASSISLQRDRQKGGHQADQVRSIWVSPLLPEDPLIWRKDLDPAVKETLRQFFLTYGQANTPAGALQRQRLAAVNIGGFKPADDNHLLPIREMEASEAFEVAKRGGDAARIAEARRSLDAIVTEREALEARTRASAATQ
jgi:phosphonate transport system substrate-binding protein